MAIKYIQHKSFGTVGNSYGINISCDQIKGPSDLFVLLQ